MARNTTKTARQVAPVASEAVQNTEQSTEVTVSTATAAIESLNQALEAKAEIGDNQPPAIVNYKPMVADAAHAVQAVTSMFNDFREISDKLGTKFDQVALMVTDLAYFLWEDSKARKAGGIIPSFSSLKISINLILEGRMITEEKDGVLTYRTVAPEKVQRTKEQAAQDKIDAKASSRDVARDHKTVADSAFLQYIDPACMCALLVLHGAEDCGKPDTGFIGGTTYRRGYRYVANQPGKNPPAFKGDAYMVNVGEGKEVKLLPYPVDEPAPEGTYLGVIFNDHAIHPSVIISSDDNGWVYQSKKTLGKYKRREFCGATIDGIKKDYARAFGDKNGVYPDIDVNTGYEPLLKRQAGGTQAEATEAKGTDTKAPETTSVQTPAGTMEILTNAVNEETVRTLDNSVRLAFLKSAKVMIFNLPTKVGSLNEEELGLLADIRLKLSDYLDMIDGDDAEAIDRIMAA